MDIVYQPLQTRLLREAAGPGRATIDGLQMLIHQATAQFELWTGQEAPLGSHGPGGLRGFGAKVGCVPRPVFPSPKIRTRRALPACYGRPTSLQLSSQKMTIDGMAEALAAALSE